MKIMNYESKDNTKRLGDLAFGECYKLVEEGVIYMKVKSKNNSDILGVSLEKGNAYVVDNSKEIIPVTVIAKVTK